MKFSTATLLAALSASTAAVHSSPVNATVTTPGTDERATAVRNLTSSAYYSPPPPPPAPKPILPECHADCDWDEDCADGLSCWYRESGESHDFRHLNFPTDSIPGCPGIVPSDPNRDFCIDPHKFPAATLFYAGLDGWPRVVYPLKECWGDCKKVCAVTLS